jgi:hypothetical protein
MRDVVNRHSREIDRDTRDELRRPVTDREILRPKKLLFFCRAIRPRIDERLPPQPRLTEVRSAGGHFFLDTEALFRNRAGCVPKIEPRRAAPRGHYTGFFI